MNTESSITREKIEPTILTIFGATGELSSTRLLPALHRLFADKLLPGQFAIVGFARSPFSEKEFRGRVAGFVDGASDKFLQKIYYSPGNFGEAADFKKLAQKIQKLESKRHSCANRLFYFATLPSHYQTISHELESAGLLHGCARHKRTTRVIVEKPFGSDLKSAQKLDLTLQKYFREDQIYRIDHYLGKETVQNLQTARFANSIFEPVWNSGYIDHIQISSMQETGIGNRGAFYEQTGAIRDIIQNHLMQLLALIAMEQPADLSAGAIRDERAKVIRAIRKPSPADLKNDLVIGQYQAYRKESNVPPRSKVETYAAMKLYIDNARWRGVPFYFRTGKFISRKMTRISIHFKPHMPHLFADQPVIPNVLTFEIQPNEGIFLGLAAKFPGFGIRLHPVTMELGYHSAFHGEFPEAYERLLLDFAEGDQRLFARSDEIEESWKYIDEVEKFMAKGHAQLQSYERGSWGPAAAERMMVRDGRSWYN